MAVASSAIAALILHGGRTAHSTFNIPIKMEEWTTCGIQPGTDLADTLAQAAIIIWDEAPMARRQLFEAVDRTFRDVLQARPPPSRR